jgi:DNA-binding PadR family transcriptional regulator
MAEGQWDDDTGRKARFYSVTAAGRKQLEEEERRWVALTDAVNKALRFA